MANKILSLVKNMNKPLERFLLINGWNHRLKRKINNGLKLRKLTVEQKKDIKIYWSQYGKRVNPNWVAYFSYANGIVDPRYIPESLYYGEIAKMLYVQGMGGLHHKNVQEQIFNSKQPRTIVRKVGNTYTDNEHRPISFERSVQLCLMESEIIIKPSTGTYGGKGIIFWKPEDGENKLRDILSSLNQVIVQEVVKSHEFMKEITDSSINTLRVVTLLVDGEPKLLSTLLRMAKEGRRLDGVAEGGIIGVVNKNGYLEESTIQLDQTIRKQHDSGFIFKDKKIPSYTNLINEAFEQHCRIPYFKMVSWDYAIDSEGDPVLIEANIPTGQIDFHQINIGPIFGEYTDRVLEHVYKGKEL